MSGYSGRQSNERDKAAEAIRALIDRIVLTPTEDPAGVTASIHGDLANVLQWLGERCKQTKTPLAFASGVCVLTSDRLDNSITPESTIALVAGAATKAIVIPSSSARSSFVHRDDESRPCGRRC
jgi:hypothetical protein